MSLLEENMIYRESKRQDTKKYRQILKCQEIEHIKIWITELLLISIIRLKHSLNYALFHNSFAIAHDDDIHKIICNV